MSPRPPFGLILVGPEVALGVEPPALLAPASPMFVRYAPKMASVLQRMTAWICLAAAFLTGLAPAHGFVLCLQPNGRVSVDLSNPDERCDGCEDQEQGTAPDAHASRAPGHACCDCLDLPLSGSLQDRLNQAGPIAPQFGPWVALETRTALAALNSIAPTTRASQAEVPRPPDAIALIRCVVLLL